MTGFKPENIKAVEWVMPCAELAVSLDFYTRELGFRIEAIFPADAPRTAVISGYGSRIRLIQSDESAPARLNLVSHSSGQPEKDTPLLSPDGTRIDWCPLEPGLIQPRLESTLVVQKADQDSWGEGRAGMQYRDLVPGRQGGGFIASHIRIPEGGPVPDYVHHHGVVFQVIYCTRGWVKVVYQDQGPALTMQAGDCVLQPPGIRHRVLECSPGLEVVEVGAPAEHMTFVDHELELPSAAVDSNRKYGGQGFVFHRCAPAVWERNVLNGFEIRDTGITEATGGLASVQVLRNAQEGSALNLEHKHDLQFHFVLQGKVRLSVDEQNRGLEAGDAFIIPPAMPGSLDDATDDLELLRISVLLNT
jgi:quercetin dioxygenase-like cupin family protein